MLDQNTLDDIIRRIVEVAQPERIVLFGSAARGAVTRNSDVDLLIIKEGGDANLRTRIYEKLYGVPVAVDCDPGFAGGRRALQGQPCVGYQAGVAGRKGGL